VGAGPVGAAGRGWLDGQAAHNQAAACAQAHTQSCATPHTPRSLHPHPHPPDPRDIILGTEGGALHAFRYDQRAPKKEAAPQLLLDWADRRKAVCAVGGGGEGLRSGA
jgi:hypothetical protein